MQQAEDAWAGALLTLRLWQGRHAEIVPVMSRSRTVRCR